MTEMPCPACQEKIASWMIKREAFECPHCKKAVLSNYRALSKKAMRLGLLVWLLVVVVVGVFSEPWYGHMVLSLELGGAGFFLTAYLLMRNRVRLSPG